ncbi:MAG: GTP pyrophosphokinase family protein, partial [Acutalibacteraceae bacterium]|nr:GTP pyrophosphokinase family protein [Acutalibacteraceae bacterium]
YNLANRLCSQDDIKLIEKKDYIKNPKENGYRSLHLILEIPIFLLNEKKYMRVEVQFRTIAMDFWASLEHKVRYKKEIAEKNDAEISKELKQCADEISQLDLRMQDIRRKIDFYKNNV